MAPINLKKLISRHAISDLLREAEVSLGGSLIIQDADGGTIWGGESKKLSERKPVNLGSEVIGWVAGGEQASVVASFLTYAAKREFETKSLARETLDRYRELILLYTTAEHITACVDLREIGEFVIEEAMKLTHASGGKVLVRNEAADQLDIIAALGDEYCPKASSNLVNGIACSVLSSGKAEIVNDVKSDSRYAPGEANISSLMCAPLKTKGGVIGVFQIGSENPASYTSEDLKLFTTLASQTAFAIENARMYAELERSYKEENVRLRRQIETRYRFDKIKGNSKQMLQVFKLLEKVIDSEITVLIEGETGTGKELIARCIHHNGPRKDKPFVTQNCSAVPETLLASELFGHKKGAFTGAFKDKKGLFEIAHGGTVFLDEVAEMSPAMQTSLLRALQEGEIKPVGAEATQKVDVRIISATNRSLDEDRKNGRFREDLYYRISVFPVRLPPLRERVDDIPILVSHFISEFNRKYNKTIKGVTRQAMDAILKFPFPGNVRELENEIERAMAMAGDKTQIDMDDLSEKIQSESAVAGSEREGPPTLKAMVEQLEKKLLAQGFEKHKGNKTQIAKELGLSRLGLMKKMKRYGM